MKQYFAIILLIIATAAPGKADPVTYTESTAPHPSMKAPDGWQITVASNLPFTYTTKLQNGETITLAMPAYELLPVGSNLSYFIEPGYAGAQNHTLDRVMKDTTLTLDAKIDQLKAISSQLGQIGKHSQ